MAAHVITAAVIKGGTGKTTTAAAFAQAARADKKKVLGIDLDPQGNLTAFLKGDEARAGSYALLHGADVSTVIQTTAQGLDIIPANADLATERTTAGSAKRLYDAIAPIKERYDFIIIDTPPSMGELTFNAIQASTALLIPLDADTASIKGLYQIADIAARMKERRATDLSFIGVLLTRYRARANINQFLREKIEEAAGKISAEYMGEIRDGIAIREAQAMSEDLFEYAPKSNPAQDYMKLYKEYIKATKRRA